MPSDDAAVRGKGWRKAKLTESGETYEEYFTPALNVVLNLARKDKKLRLWSGASCPAPSTTMRESPMDGDAFRENEAEVVSRHGLGSCVLGAHLCIENILLSRSGGVRM